MRILKIIHGYPPLYNAGSEVYSQMLCRELSKFHEIVVFAREENPFMPAFSMRTCHDNKYEKIKINLINIPLEKYRYRYQQPEVDQQLKNILHDYQPEIVHVGHLNHLSTSLIKIIKQYNIPCLYTLHDYWLMCPRGQFIQRNAEPIDGVDATMLYRLCDGQEDKKCASNCYTGYYSGLEKHHHEELTYWTTWIKHRMQHITRIINDIDLFIAPSRYLMHRFTENKIIPEEKMCYLDYGFNLDRFAKRSPNTSSSSSIVFGYIGTHIPGKGVQHLINAFNKVEGDCKLIIWGRASGQNTAALERMAATVELSRKNIIYFAGEYVNDNIVEDVFAHIDVLVVPSIWVENSPLVIHEALQAKKPVITADAGGMAEYIQHGVNGLLFKHRDVDDLARQMQKLIQEPELAIKLGQRGYLQSHDGNIPDIRDHCQQVITIYRQLIKNKRSQSCQSDPVLGA